jgi:hypothetical protein
MNIYVGHLASDITGRDLREAFEGALYFVEAVQQHAVVRGALDQVAATAGVGASEAEKALLGRAKADQGMRRDGGPQSTRAGSQSTDRQTLDLCTAGLLAARPSLRRNAEKLNLAAIGNATVSGTGTACKKLAEAGKNAIAWRQTI